MGLLNPKAPGSSEIPLYLDDYRDTLDAVDEHGHVPVPQGPGLGVEINWDWVNQHRTNLLVYE
jgi:L-alanine-DL-glutamate epimerase-like enolase superfamily enzyme